MFRNKTFIFFYLGSKLEKLHCELHVDGCIQTHILIYTFNYIVCMYVCMCVLCVCVCNA